MFSKKRKRSDEMQSFKMNIKEKMTKYDTLLNVIPNIWPLLKNIQQIIDEINKYKKINVKYLVIDKKLTFEKIEKKIKEIKDKLKKYIQYSKQEIQIIRNSKSTSKSKMTKSKYFELTNKIVEIQSKIIKMKIDFFDNKDISKNFKTRNTKQSLIKYKNLYNSDLLKKSLSKSKSNGYENFLSISHGSVYYKSQLEKQKCPSNVKIHYIGKLGTGLGLLDFSNLFRLDNNKLFINEDSIKNTFEKDDIKIYKSGSYYPDVYLEYDYSSFVNEYNLTKNEMMNELILGNLGLFDINVSKITFMGLYKLPFMMKKNKINMNKNNLTDTNLNLINRFKILPKSKDTIKLSDLITQIQNKVTNEKINLFVFSCKSIYKLDSINITLNNFFNYYDKDKIFNSSNFKEKNIIIEGLYSNYLDLKKSKIKVENTEVFLLYSLINISRKSKNRKYILVIHDMLTIPNQEISINNDKDIILYIMKKIKDSNKVIKRVYRNLNNQSIKNTFDILKKNENKKEIKDYTLYPSINYKVLKV